MRVLNLYRLMLLEFRRKSDANRFVSKRIIQVHDRILLIPDTVVLSQAEATLVKTNLLARYQTLRLLKNRFECGTKYLLLLKCQLLSESDRFLKSLESFLDELYGLLVVLFLLLG